MQGEKRDREEEVVAQRPKFADIGATPGWIRDLVYATFPIDFEPGETPNFVPLVQEWKGFSFAHPPHEEAQLWCEKAVTEAKKGHISVLLLPAVFNSIYWRSVVYPNATDIRILACPLKRPGQKKQIVSQMAFVVFAGRDDQEAYPPIVVMEPEDWETHYYKKPRNKARFAIKR